MTPLRTRKPVDEEVIGYHHTEMVKCLGQIENVWLGGGKKKFLAGDQISIADLMASAELEQPGGVHNPNISRLKVLSIQISSPPPSP